MKELIDLKDKLTNERPAGWYDFPDIGLYKDQVLSYLQRQLINFRGEEQITSAMINNYIKDKLLPRADGKKYSREHLAGLTEICLLKQVLTVRDTGQLMEEELEKSDPKDFYQKFLGLLDEELTKTAGEINIDWNEENLSHIALKLAISSYCQKIACERLLDIIQDKIQDKTQVDAQKKHDKKQDGAKKHDAAKKQTTEQEQDY